MTLVVSEQVQSPLVLSFVKVIVSVLASVLFEPKVNLA
ncbi:hypothetical protein VCHENC03_2891 [Vibrio sp. HENC-03]|nr:hypothetical protein VCHENC03_2891 [Vibrio sp. HENC-03]